MSVDDLEHDRLLLIACWKKVLAKAKDKEGRETIKKIIKDLEALAPKR